MAGLAAAQRAPQRVAALLQAMVQEHERALGGWQAELAEWSGLLLLAHGGLHAMAEAAGGLQVNEARMREHIGLLEGASLAASDPDAAAAQARERAGEWLARLRTQAAALAGAHPWSAWLPSQGHIA